MLVALCSEMHVLVLFLSFGLVVGLVPLPSTLASTFSLGDFTIEAFEQEMSKAQPMTSSSRTIYMQDVASGWGNGKHPTTRLCLDFLLDNVKFGDTVLDYGTGSGILSILSKKLGSAKCLAVDIDEDSLRAAKRNAELNGYSSPGDIDVIHTKHIYIGDDSFPLSDVTVANILPGPLSRLVAPLWGLSKPGAQLCLSGMRPHELPAIRRLYEPFVDTETERVTELAHETFGPWVAWRVKFKTMSSEERREARNRLTELSME